MTQKGNLFKGKQKQKSIPPNRHGKALTTRKGKRNLKSKNKNDAEREVTKFINQCNEVKSATLAEKDGGKLSIIKLPAESAKK